MNPRNPPPPGDAGEEVSALIEVLHETGQRLEELTAGEVDAVADRHGRTVLLRRAQDHFRHTEAAKQYAILNALPAHIALLDAQGVIISVNEAWRGFAGGDAIQAPGHEIGVNYLELCANAREEGSSEAHRVAEGIRAVLSAQVKSFSIEYPCHSPTEQRWFLLMVTPLAAARTNGAVVMHLNITVRKQTAVALAQSEAGLHRAQHMAKLGHIVTGPDGSFERWSETLPQLVGVEPDQLPGTTRAWLGLLHPDDRAMFREKAIEAGVKSLRVELEYRLRRADGQWIHMRQTMEPLNDEGDAAGGSRWFNTLQDVTAERQTAESLRVTDSRFRQMAESISDVFYLRDMENGRMLYVSPAYEDIWGRSCDSLYANPESWSEAIHPDDRASTDEKNKNGLLAGEYEFEYRIVRPDGSIRWIETKGFPVRDDAGRIVRIAGIAADITARKLASDELRESERRFSDLLGNVEMVSLMLDTKARITYCNDYLLQLTDRRREEVIGSDWFELFIPPETTGMKDISAALAAARPEALHHENEILTRSGERRLIRWNNSVLRSAAGDVIGTASIGEDITERKMAEEVLTKRAAELERFHRLSVGRELQMIELKKQVNQLAIQGGQKPPYDLAFSVPKP
jgi:PAS domain S-box-containing protein